MDWYEGVTLMHLLENIHIGSDHNHVDCRFPVQYVIRPQSKKFPDYRGYSGRVEGGVYFSCMRKVKRRLMVLLALKLVSLYQQVQML